MARARLHHAFGLAAAAVVAMAYVQVSELPPSPPMSTPSVETVMRYVSSEVAWVRAEIPHSTDWWVNVADQSAGDLRVLVDALQGRGTTTP